MGTGKLNSKLDAAQIAREVFDSDAEAIRVKSIGGSLVPDSYDTIQLTYNGNGDIATAVYKANAATIATLTLSYNGSNQLISVVKT